MRDDDAGSVIPMSVSEKRARVYRMLRKRHGLTVRHAGWLSREPKYDIHPGHDDRYSPEVWVGCKRSTHGDPLDVITIDGRNFLVVFVPDDEPYDWGDLEPTDEEREGIFSFGVCVVEIGKHGGYECDAVWNCYFDDRLPTGVDDRYLREVACELIDEFLSEPVPNFAPLLLGA